MHRDDPLRPPERVVDVLRSERRRELRHRLAHRAEVVDRGHRGPVDREPAAVEVHPAVGHVTAHPEHRKRARREGVAPEHLREVARDVGLAAQAQPVGEHREGDLRRTGEDRPQLRRLDEPVEEARVPGLLDVVAAPGAAVAVDAVADADRTRDHRPAAARDATGLGHLVDLLLRAHEESEEVAVAGEPRAERGREPGQGGAVLQQQVGGAEGARAEHDPRGPHRAVDGRPPTGAMPAVPHLPSAVDGAEALHLVQCPHIGAVVGRGRDVGVVERVLRTRVAADVALARERARVPHAPVDVAVRLGLDRQELPDLAVPVGERHGERRMEHLVPGVVRGVLEGGGLGRVTVRVLRGVEEALDAVVVRVEVRSPDRPVLVAATRDRGVVHEPLGVLAQEHVRVDQRTAAEPGGRRAPRGRGSSTSRGVRRGRRRATRSPRRTRPACGRRSPAGRGDRAP